MDIVINIVVSIVICVSIPFILTVVAAPSKSDQISPNVIKYPKAFTIAGIFGILIALAAFTLCMIQGFGDNLAAELFAIITFLIIYLISIWLFVNSLNWRLMLFEERLVFKNFFGITKEYQYSDITKVCAYYRRNSKKPEKYKISLCKRKITVESVTINFDGFERIIKQRFRKSNNFLKIEVKISKL